MALRLALDTNRYTDLCRGEEEVVQIVEEASQVYLPFVVLAELRAGFAWGSRGLANERTLQRFLSKPGVEALFPSDSTSRGYANLYRQLRQQGTPIPTHDIWIAALVLEHNLRLYSRDRHFKYLPQVDLL